jgi:regulation of enolase protein 1 (concanavalin A-like superfamily)
MNRLAAFLLSALVAAAALAAPAPAPRASGPWVRGWGKPADPAGDCRFDREGERLTITVPGKGHDLDVAGGRLNAPRLLREVEGDFVVQVRVRGDFQRPDLKSEGIFRRAGLLLTTGNTYFTVQRVNDPSESFWVGAYYLGLPSIIDQSVESPAGDGSGFVRIRRRGQAVQLEASPDGKRWAGFACEGITRLPRKVKVGVLAESTAPGTFKAVFDQFRLMPLGPDGKPLGGKAR